MRLLRVLFALLLLAASAFPEGAKPALTPALSDARQEARRKLGQAALEYANFCADSGANGEARLWYGAALTIDAGETGAREAFSKIAGKPDAIAASFKKDAVARLANIKAAGKPLLMFLKDARAKNCDDLVLDDVAAWCAFAWDGKLLKSEQVEWYAPLSTLVPVADLKRLQKGELRLDGAWLTKADVAHFEKEHGDFADPWHLAGGWFEIRSDMSLARTIETRNYACLWRVHLWARFCVELDIRPPDGLLPIAACETRKSFDAEVEAFMKKFGAPYKPGNMTAVYKDVPAVRLNPVFVSREEINDERVVCAGSDASFHQNLRHELAHQLLTEGLKHKDQKNRQDCQTWASEVFGTWAETWYLREGRFEQHWIRYLPSGAAGTTLPSDLNLAQRLKDDFAPLEAFSRESRGDFLAHFERSYAQSAVTGLWRPQGGGNDARRRFMEVVEKCHTHSAKPDSFVEAFKGVDLTAVDGRIRAFLEGVKLEEFRE